MLPGTEAAAFPFWAPDSGAVAFFSAGELKRVDIDGGAPVSLAVGYEGIDGAWSADGVILFSALGDERGIFRVPENGGLVVQVTTLDESGGEIVHLHPRFLPGSQRFLYVARSATPAASALYVSSVDAPSRTRLFSTNSKVEWATTGHLLFLREATLMAQRFDDENLELVGPSFPLGEQVRVNESNGWMGPSVSGNGLLVYRPGGSVARRNASLALVGRDGGEIGRITGPVDRPRSYRLSPDGRQIAVGGGGELWIYNLDGRPPLPLVSPGASPVWTQDGGTILFASGLPVLGQVRGLLARTTGDDRGLMSIPADGSVLEAERLPGASGVRPMSVSPNGRELLFAEQSNDTSLDISVLTLDGSVEPRTWLQTRYNETEAQFSPNGDWVAYVSDRSGQQEVWVRPYPGPGAPVRVSSGTGSVPRWSDDGGELYFWSSGDMMVTQVRLETRFQFELPTSLFSSPARRGRMVTYDVAPEGHFLMRISDREETATHEGDLNVVLNWFEELTQRVPIP